MAPPAATVAAGPSRGVAKRPVSATVPKASVSAASAGTKRPGWDLKGKVADMEGKLASYQTKVKSSTQDNMSLKAAVTEKDSKIRALQSRLGECEAELQVLSGVKADLQNMISSHGELQSQLLCLE